MIAGYHRLKLGVRYKHQYNCHRDFLLQREETHCAISWHGNHIANIPYAGSLTHQSDGPCFIIASGPSLADIDLKTLTGFHTISLNCAIKKFIDQGTIPTHCVIVDHRVFERQWACVEAAICSGAQCFFTFEGLSIIAQRAPKLFTRGNIFLIESISKKFGIPRSNQSEFLATYTHSPTVYLDAKLPQYCRSIGFSCDLKQGVFSGKTVATWAVQLSFCLGYKSIFIVGMDLGGTGKAHFYADQHNPSPDFLRYYEPHIRACFELAKQACDHHGIQLYNLSMHSTLPTEIVPKIPFNEAISLANAYLTH